MRWGRWLAAAAAGTLGLPLALSAAVLGGAGGAGTAGTLAAVAVAAGPSVDCQPGAAAAPAPGQGAITMVEAVRAARTAGWPEAELVTFGAVAAAESGLRPQVVNSIGASGLMQILRSAHADRFALEWQSGSWANPTVNARMALVLWRERGWQPWEAHSLGMHRAHVPAAGRAVEQLGVEVTATDRSAEQGGDVCVPVGGRVGSEPSASIPCTVGGAGVVERTPKGTAIRVCDAGRGLVVDTRLAPGVARLLQAADAAGMRLAGSGFRSTARQIELRKAHCGAGWASAPSSSCSPPTALPGRSEHEVGQAVDLTCDGTLIRSRGNRCFRWLQRWAGPIAGLRNLPSESWHWSVSGR